MRIDFRSRFPLLLQLCRFGITGTLATITHFTTVVLLVQTRHIHPLTANVFGFICGFVVSFSGHRFWTFAGTTQQVKVTLSRFMVVAIINFFCNQSLYYFFLNILHWNYSIALLLVLGIMASCTFLLSKFWVFQ